MPWSEVVTEVELLYGCFTDGQQAAGSAQGPTGGPNHGLFPLSQAGLSPFALPTRPLVWDPKSWSSSGEPGHRNPQGGLLKIRFS